MAISPARTAAFDNLLLIHSGRGHSSALLAESAGSLDRKDRALCHELTLGTLRNQMLLDARLVRLSKRPLTSLDPEILISLRLGLYQLGFLDRVPAHAAINDSVELVARARKVSAKAFVNGVLRASTRSKIDLEFDDPTEKLSVTGSHPRWLLDRWIDRFGFEAARRIVSHNNAGAVTEFRFTRRFDRLPKGQKLDLMKIAESRSVPGAIGGRVFKVTENNERLRELFEEGFIYFQDEGSVVVADSLDVSPGNAVLDVCAAPGGKTTQIARTTDPDLGILVGCDVSEGRTKVLKEMCSRQDADFVDIVMLDAEHPLPFDESAFDKVLVDAPCTGTGTIAQNPEIRYRLVEEDLARFPEKQLVILSSASKAVKSGGTLIYSTCSLETEENDGVVDRFLSLNPVFRPERPFVPIGLMDGSFKARILPQKGASAGFFIAGFRRTG